MAFFLLISALLSSGASARTAEWSEAAASWEETARHFEDIGEGDAALEAWGEAARAWERSAALQSRVASDLPLDERTEIYDLEQALDRADAALEGWRRAAISWGGAADLWASAGREEDAATARERASEALDRAEEIEGQRSLIRAHLDELRANLLDAEVSPGLRRELVERWAEAARSWEETSRLWEEGGNEEEASRARLEAEGIRDRIRNVWPDVPPEWLAERTYPEPSPGREEPSAPPEIPVFTVEIPEIPPPLAMPPRWRMLPKEIESSEAAEVWREAAATWARTAEARRAEGEIVAARRASRRAAEASARAIALEMSARRTYAAREAEIMAATVEALGEGTAPTPEDILAALDEASLERAEAVDTSLPGEEPPVLTGIPSNLEPPPLPPEEYYGRDTGAGLIDLEFGGPIPSTLTVHGRKVVEFNYSYTKYLEESPNREGGNTQSDIEINQELQVDVLGVVGEPLRDHINVNIHFDDTERGVNQVNNRTIVVEFDGVEHERSFGSYEINAAFGDINLALPGSEFALYNKSLFGVRADVSFRDFDISRLSFDRFTLMAIASQTKGISASREFSTSGQREVQDIDDISFVTNTYYQIDPDAAALPITNVSVYLDNQNASDNDGTVNFLAQGADGGAGYTHTGNWDILVNGIDYIVDLSTGILEMTGSASGNDIICIEYDGADGSAFSRAGPTPPRLIKVESDTVGTARSFFRTYELRNRYQLSRRRIRKNDPDFVFQIRDELGASYPANDPQNRTYLEIFGFDSDGDKDFDIERLDYDFGVIEGADSTPFLDPAEPTLSNSALYDRDDPDMDDKKYTIHIEYVSDLPQEIYTLGFDIISGSDIVTVDGVEAVRNRDYVIDYEAGIITFINTAILSSNSTVRVDYEYLPLGGQFERTILGFRGELEYDENITLGSTALFDLSQDIDEVPTVFQSTPDDLSIIDYTYRFDISDILFSWIDRFRDDPFAPAWQDNFALSVNGEIANSTFQPNTYGTAIVEDFETVEDLTSMGMGQTSWLVASPPPPLAGTPGASNIAARGNYTMTEKEDFGHLSSSLVAEDEIQRSLRIDLTYDVSDTWVALRQAVGISAVDFSDVTTIEVYLKGAEGLKVYLDVGIISEDSDGDGTLDTEDFGLDGVPGTGDAGEDNNILNTGEDVGINSGTDNYGAGDGVLQTEDMDLDFILDSREAFYRFGELNSSPGVDSQPVTGSDGTNWYVYRIPWSNGVPNNADADSTVVKHVRLWFVRDQGFDSTATVYTDEITFRRAKFTGADSGSGLTLITRNAIDDQGQYSSPPGIEAWRSGDASSGEQSLGIQWSIAAGDSATIRQSFIKSADIADYRTFSFFVAGDAGGESVTLRLLTDENNYFEYETPIDYGSNLNGGAAPVWKRFDIDIETVRSLTINNILGSGDTIVERAMGTNSVFRIVGEPLSGRSPSLSNLNDMWIILTNPAGNAVDSGEIWVNEIHVKDPPEQEGTAQRVGFTTGWGSFWSLSGSLRDIDNDFRGIGFINNPQASTYDRQSTDARSLSGHIDLHRLLPESWRLTIPLSGSWSRSESSLDPDRIDVALNSSLGTSISRSQAYSTTVRWRNFPAVSLSYSDNRSDVDYRNEDRSSRTRTTTGSTGYSYSFPRRLWDRIPTGRSLSTSITYSFTSNRFKEQNFSSAYIDRFSSDFTQNIGWGVNSTPINPLTIAYSFSETLRNYRTQDDNDRYEGMTARNQSLRNTFRIPSRWGFNPNLSVGGGYSESFYNNTAGNREKDASLNGDFNFGLGTNPGRWTRLLSFLTMRYGYTIRTSASYRNLPPGTGFSGLFSNYVGERLWPWGQSTPAKVEPSGVTSNRTTASNTGTHTLSGGLRTWDWLQTSYSTSLIRTESISGASPAITDAFNANLNFQMNYMQAFPHSFLHFRSSLITMSLPYSTSENSATRSVSLSPNMNWNMQWSDRLNTAFSLSWSRSSSTPSPGASGTRSLSRTLSPGLTFQYDFDLGVPEGVELPGARRIELQRRVQLRGGINASFRRAESGGSRTTAQDEYGMNLSLAYRISQGLEFSANANGSYLLDDLEELQNRFTIGAGSRLEWRF